MELDQMMGTMNRISRQMQRKITHILKDYELSSMHAPYLRLLFICKDGQTQKELTEALGVNKANTTRVVFDLMEKGYVFKEESCKTKGNRIYLTEKGQKLAKWMQEYFMKIKDEIMQCLTEEEKKQFEEIVCKIVSAMEDITRIEENIE